MSTRLSIYCDKLLEAGWLAALVVAPLFFNVYSSRVFEPDKATLIRSLALVMVGAWIIKQLEIGWRAASQNLDAPSPQRAPVVQVISAMVRDNPFALPVFAIIAAYIIATVFSVVPGISLWGSYQRLQGTYSTFSYIAISVIAASALRTRAQLDRAVNTILVVSFPIAFYGILQHFRLDPLPWGGDTTERVAANMGNSIFVAAYLIMAVPLAFARWLETLARATRPAAARVLPITLVTLILAALSVLWMLDFALGTSLALAFIVGASAFALIAKKSFRDALLTATYTVLLAVLFVSVFFTQSRGPWLGLAGGLFAFVVLYALTRGARQVVLLAIGFAIVASAFLAVFNLSSSPLDPLKQVPYVGRLGRFFETESGTGKVRELIWEGALPLFLPHQPLWSPTTGDDPFNVIRPLVGYGPEAMYVAFNPFYPPDLAHYEARNASPDRAHNETWDSLVMTGLLGFGAYILLFVSVFYFGLKWLGFIRTLGERNAFIALWLTGGLVSTVFFGLWRGWSYLGVALPFGMIIGFFIFLIADAIRHYGSDLKMEAPRALWISALIAALIGHFIEIHFGIAIVATRTYFWFYVALLVILGMNKLDTAPETVASRQPPVNNQPPAPRRKHRRRGTETQRTRESQVEISPVPVVAWTAVTTLIGVTLAFEFVTNQIGTFNSLELLRASLFSKGGETSFGVALLFGLTWLIAGIVGLGEEYSTRASREVLVYEIALFVILAFTAWLWFTLIQTRWLTQAGDLTPALIALLGFYYIALFVFVAAVAFGLWIDVTPRPRAWLRSPLNLIVTPILLIALPALIYLTNYAGVAADIHYKAGLNYDSTGMWDRSIGAYQRAFTLQPTQDFYALFLGRANLEAARATTDTTRRSAFVAASEKILLTAQRLNPLNTDHTANLARLNRIVASFTTDPAEKAARYAQSSEYYHIATRLSPNTAYLYNEWFLTYLQSGDWEKARAALEKSLTLDDRYAQTYLYLGDYYRIQNDNVSAVENYLKAIAIDARVLAEPDGMPMPGPLSVLALPENIARATDAFRAASQRDPKAVFPHLALADLYKRTNQRDLARRELEQAVEMAPTDLLVNLALINFLSETGQIDAAVPAMGRLMNLLSPQTPDYQRYQEFYSQLQNLQKQMDAVRKAPNDVNARRALAQMWKLRGQPQFALPEYQALARLAPNDYDAQKNVALLSLQTNQWDDAQRALVSAAALAPENEKPMWQNIQAALNALKTNQADAALTAAQAALALAPDADKTAVQAWVNAIGK